MAAPFLPVEPAALGRGQGFSHGLMAPADGRVLFVAGQTAPDAVGASAVEAFVAQFDGALDRVCRVVAEAGGTPECVGRMTVFVTSMQTYRESRPRLSEAWHARMGRHFPAMSVVEVSALVEPDALVEIEATAVLP